MKYLLLTACLLSSLLSSAQNHADCASAFWLGANSSRHFMYAYGEGDDTEEAAMVACFINGTQLGQAEKNSTWISFGIKQGGTLRFTITPDTLGDDYDFVLFQLPPSGDCRDKAVVRCMAAGDDFKKHPKSPCLGATGLRDKDKDTSEDAGCLRDDDAWLKPLAVRPGERYVLLVSNTTSPNNGFTIRFTGDFTFMVEAN